MARGKGRGIDYDKLLRQAGDRAAKVLADPAVRAMLAAQAAALARKARTWSVERRSSGEPTGLRENLAQRFGHGRLEKRVANLRSALDALDRNPDLAGRLAPVRSSLDQVEISLTVAKSMPTVSRLQAQRRIDATLDQLEHGLFDVTLNQG